MASLIVPTTPVSRRALEATPSKKVSQKRLACVNFTLFYLQGCSRFSGHIFGLSHKTYSKTRSN
jgi:hypothetical protein